MQKTISLLIVLLTTVLLFSCLKDTELQEQSSVSNTIQNTTSSNKVAFECPEFEDIATANFDLFDYFGWVNNPPFGSDNHGTIDAVANCPAVALEYCERACSGFPIVTFNNIQSGGFFNKPWETGNSFTIAEQETILDAGLSKAITQAPTCPNTNIKMEPVAYDFFIDVFLCCPNPIPGDPCCEHYYEIGVHVKYAPPCGRFEVQ